MKNKIGIAITALLFCASTAAAATGYMYDQKRNDDKPKENENKNLVTYEYYLDDVKQDTMPQKEDIIDEFGNPTGNQKYMFSRFSCTNNISGTFDEDNWNFISNDETKESVCSLYFVNSQYNVTVDARGGIVTTDNPSVVQRGADVQFKITPDEGYEFKGTEIVCSNNKTASWDESTNTLSVNGVTENMACTISFEIKELRVDITVKNGTGNTTENTTYGGSISAIVEPKDEYENPTISCTNNQEAQFKDNKLIIDKLTDNTACTVTFKKVTPNSYKLSLTDIPEEVTVTSGSNEISVVSGGTATFTLKPNEGYDVNVDCGSIKESSKDSKEDGSVTYNFLSVKQDINCKVTATQKPVEPASSSTTESTDTNTQN